MSNPPMGNPPVDPVVVRAVPTQVPVEPEPEDEEEDTE